MWRIQTLLANQKRRCHTPVVLQMEAVECGAAALGIILGYYGRIVPLAELRQACGVSRNGSSALNIIKAAKNYGLDAKGFKTSLAALQQVKCPYIVFWKFNHFVVVEGFGKQQVYLNDPASGPYSVSLEEFNGAYTGVVIVLKPTDEFKRGGHKKSVIQSLWSRLQSSTGALIYSIVAGFLLVIPGLAVPAFSQVFVDYVLIQHRDEWLRPLIVGIIFTALLNGCLTLLQLQSLRRLKIKLAVGMTSRFVWHILRLPLNFYEQRFSGEISSRVQLNDSIANTLSGRLATSAIALVSVCFYLIVMLQYDAILTSVAIAFVLMNLAALQWVRRQRVNANKRLIQEYGKASGVGISGLQSIEMLKASGLESDFFSRWAGYYAKAINARQSLEVSNQILGILPSFLSAITQMLILVVGGVRVMDGVLSIGMLVAFSGMMQRFLTPVNNLVNLGSDLQEMEGNLNRLDDVLDNPTDSLLSQENVLNKSFKAPHPLASFVRLEGNVELRNLTFGYSHIEPPLIENFNLKLKKGQRVALVGASGCGKSTIAKLICGLYEPWSGEILFDGEPRRQIPRSILGRVLKLA